MTVKGLQTGVSDQKVNSERGYRPGFQTRKSIQKGVTSLGFRPESQFRKWVTGLGFRYESGDLLGPFRGLLDSLSD